MHELSLFSGAGGGLLGSLLLGWKPIGYVEYNDYCQRVIAQRIADGILPDAPIFGDVRAFISEGYAASYTGMVDVISGGFPCQPFSNAGKRLGADDPRNMWPATIECISIIRPRYAFLENVPGILSSGYFGTILGDLAESGYDARWRILSAAELGAPHKRDRLWIVAADTRSAERRPPTQPGQSHNGGQHALSQGWQQSTVGLADLREDVADTNGANGKAWSAHGMGNQEQNRGRGHAGPSSFGSTSTDMADTAPIHVQGRHDGQRQGQLGRSSWWEVEPDVGRVANGVASRVDRLKAIGNGQVSIVASTAWHLLTEGLL